MPIFTYIMDEKCPFIHGLADLPTENARARGRQPELPVGFPTNALPALKSI
jgi:hypothetical protein